MMEEIKDKIVRIFIDNEDNLYKIYKKPNNHYYLTIRKKGERCAEIFNGSKFEIFMRLQNIHKNTNFRSI
jgi:hypothetical protein